ncbi:MAG: tetratricopeptide repeat protein [Planctomycetaceae bacterium]
MIRHCRTLLLGLPCFALLLFPATLWSQDTKPESSEVDLQSLLKKVVGRLDRVEQELRDLKLKTAGLERPEGQLPEDKDQRQLYLQLEHPFYSQMLIQRNQRAKYFIAKLTCLNLTEKPIELSTETLTLNVDGVNHKLSEESDATRNQGFQSEGQVFQIRNLPMLDRLTIESGHARSTWILFSELPYTPNVPKMNLVIKSENQEPFNYSINEAAEQRLDLDVEMIGPRESLGLLTVNGIIDNLSMGTLVDKITKLNDQKISRFVLRFGESATISDNGLQNWLVTQAQAAGSNAVNQSQVYPPFPINIRELHLAELPDDQSNRGGQSRYVGNNRVHESTTDAVEEALKSIYENLPRPELITEITKGHPLTRIVALKHGGARLMDEQLPLVIELADDGDPQLQKAALYALRHFNNADAFDKLEDYVRRNIDGLSEIAIDSLAASRFGEAHERLLSILNNEPPESKTEFVKILSENPRPIWSDTIYSFLKEETDSDYRAEALQALNRIGHPKLLEVLESSLANRDREIQRIAFLILATRNDPESEELALNYTLKYIEKEDPTDEMHKLIVQTKSQEAIPLLIAQLEQPNSNERRKVLETLAEIGDQSVASRMVDIYPKLKSQEKAIALKSLWDLKSPAAFELSKQALSSSDHILIRSAILNLTDDGSDTAVELLVKSFEETTNQQIIGYLAHALGQIRSTEAKAALTKASLEGEINKQDHAYKTLLTIWRASPGAQYVSMGRGKIETEQYDEALEDFTTAIKIDPELPDAWTARGNVYMKTEKLPEALSDFQKAREFNPRDEGAITCTAIVLVRQGENEKAFETLKENEHFFQDGQLGTHYFAYNSACVYGVALELLRNKKDKGEAPADFEQLEAEYENKAVEALRRSVNNNFEDLDWMRKDPDLNSLHENKEFRKISQWKAEG